MKRPYSVSDHFDGALFLNPDGRGRQKFKEWLRWMLREPKARWPKQVQNKVRPQLPARFFGPSPKVTFIFHACFLIQWEGLNILIDPVYSRRCSPVSFAGPSRVREPAIPFQQLPKIDVVLISHNHYDHLDANTVRRLANLHSPTFICPLGDEKLLRKMGVRKVFELDWWQSAPNDLPIRIVFTQAQHWSGRGWRDQMRSLWGGFYLENETKKIFFAGDTGYGSHFSLLRRTLGAPDLALLPVGAYQPRWFMKDHHMNPEDAVRAHLDLRARQSVGMHFGSFQLSNEAIDAHEKDLADARAKYNISAQAFRLMEFGETLDLPQYVPAAKPFAVHAW